MTGILLMCFTLLLLIIFLFAIFETKRYNREVDKMANNVGESLATFTTNFLLKFSNRITNNRSKKS